MARFFRAAIFMLIFLYAGRAFAAGGTCPSGANYLNSIGQLVTLTSLGVTNCYYITADGSDSNDGLSEASGHPWAHLPGMSTCTGNCAAVTPAAGMGFIFRGGDTWNGSNLGINWNWGGTATSPIYIGVDPAWHSGSSWSRPIWTCGGADCSGATAAYYFQSSKSYITVDNIEVPGFFVSSTNTGAYIFGACGANQIYENIYAHGWSTNVGPIGTVGTVFHGGCGNDITGTTFRYNVLDGSDTSQNMMTGIYPVIPIAYGNVIRYVVTGIDGPGDIWHDNLVEYLVQSTVTSHQDGMYHVTQYSVPNSLIYNNVIRNTTNPLTAGAVKLWLNGNAACPYSSCTSYAFNNVIYNNYPGNMVDVGGHEAVNYGTWYIFNNTFDCGMDSVLGPCAIGDQGNTGGAMTLYAYNNHWISTSSGPSQFTCTKTFICNTDTTNDVVQTLAVANGQGYNDTGTYGFIPTSSSGSTVGKGTDQSSLCTAVNTIDSDAGAACNASTAYACAYNLANHTVSCPARTAVARPSGAWDVGAYQFSTTATQAAAPKPPQGLVASVQ